MLINKNKRLKVLLKRRRLKMKPELKKERKTYITYKLSVSLLNPLDRLKLKQKPNNNKRKLKVNLK